VFNSIGICPQEVAQSDGDYASWSGSHWFESLLSCGHVKKKKNP
jgi:hypothetical protein